MSAGYEAYEAMTDADRIEYLWRWIKLDQAELRRRAGRIEELERFCRRVIDEAQPYRFGERAYDLRAALADANQRAERAEALLDTMPGFVPGYLAGWNDAKAGRQYGEGRDGPRALMHDQPEGQS